MTTETVTTISDPYRAKITAARNLDGGVLIRGPRSFLLLSETELDRLVAFVRDEPPKARLQRFPMATENPLAAG
jgi:hypothetical protein